MFHRRYSCVLRIVHLLVLKTLLEMVAIPAYMDTRLRRPSRRSTVCLRDSRVCPALSEERVDVIVLSAFVFATEDLVGQYKL